MTTRDLLLKLVLVCAFAGCAFSKPGTSERLFAQNELGLTVDWMMAGQTQPDATLKATRLLTPSGEVYRADAPVTLPAAVPQALVLMGEFPESQVTEGIDFLRGVIRIGEKTVYVPAQLVAEEPNGGKRRLSFQVTGLNAAFRAEKSGQGRLQIEIFSRSRRIGILEVEVRTPPSEIQIEEIPIQAWESRQAQGDMSEYLKPVLAGKQMNLVRVIRYSNTENTPVQIQTPRRTKGTLTQWTNHISYSQAECSYSYGNNPADEVLGSDVITLPLDDRFITEAEKIIPSPEVDGNLSSTIQPGSDAFFGIYALGDGADQWMNNGPSGPEISTVAAIAACGTVCTRRVCESSAGRDHFLASPRDILSCECEQRERTYSRVNVMVGVDRRGVVLNFPKEVTVTSLRFADLDPHRDGEVRIVPVLSEQSEVVWLR